MCAALVRHRIGYTIVRWIRAIQEGCLAAAALNGFIMRDAVSRGCPQGGVLSLLLWCLVDDMIARLNGGGIYTQGYTDIYLLHDIWDHAEGPPYRRDMV